MVSWRETLWVPSVLGKPRVDWARSSVMVSH